ncbi:MAG: AAA family ATPase, partial [Anaerolineaceae bacterium]|nr:AAA family ATPase [Anaerolineaceae bacterium]
SRILKNDYGRGGAWPFYWGVFYQKGSHKNSSNRLDTCIASSHLRFGTGFGFDSNQAKIRFNKNCRENLPAVRDIIENIFSNGEYLLYKEGETEFDAAGIADIKSQSFTWQEWLSDTEMSKYSVTKVLPKSKVIQMSFEELVSQVSDVFNQLFPIILLAIEDDPMPKIFDYLEITQPNPPQPEYTIKMVVENTGFQESEIRRWVKAIRRKGQAIIYGPPGTGKTYIAEKLARHLIGGGDGFYELVQFHPEVSYEDFIQGIRPEPLTGGGLHYPVVPGRFLKFCDKASSRNDTCVLIIDEINRANLARVFGELMYLLEYRDNSINLSAGTSFSIPKNVKIIGTMNTADRSIALVDHALRRRFAFLALYPDFEILRKYHQREQTGTLVTGLIAVLNNLNDEIQDRHYMIGTSYFLRRDLEDQMEDIWRMEIEPYLEEFFFDQPDKYKKFTWENVSAKIM